MECWNISYQKRISLLILFLLLSALCQYSIIPKFHVVSSQQFIIPIPQKIALMNNGITSRIEEAPVFFLLAILVYLC